MSKRAFIISDKVIEAHESALDFIHEWYDSFGFLQLLEWKRLGERSIDMNLNLPEETVVPYIIEIEKWKDRVMYEYLMVKKPLIQDKKAVSLDYSYIGEPPYKFTDLFLIVNLDKRPDGWILPELP